jgi:hypothetical protein
MPQHPALPDDTVHDETVRMRADGADGRPTPDGVRPAPVEEFDDTRPVTRDWLLGAPDAAVPAGPDAESRPAASDLDAEHSTQRLDAVRSDRSATATDTVVDAPADHANPSDAIPTEPVHADPDSAGTDTPPPPGIEPPSGGRGWRRRRVLVPAGVLALLAAAYGADLLISSGDIPRGTVVAGIDIGGLSPAAAATTLEEQLAPRINAEHRVRADDVTAPFSPLTAGITLDVDATIDSADDQPLNPWTRVITLFGDREVEPTFTGEETALGATMDAIAAQVDRAPVDASIVIEGTTPSVTEPADGRTLDREGAAEAVFDALQSGADPSTPIDLPVDVTPVHVDAAEAERVRDETVTPALSGPVTVVVDGRDDTAVVSVEAIAASLTSPPRRTASSLSVSTRTPCRRPWATHWRCSAAAPRTPASRSPAERSPWFPRWTAPGSLRRLWPSSCCRSSPRPATGPSRRRSGRCPPTSPPRRPRPSGSRRRSAASRPTSATRTAARTSAWWPPRSTVPS